VRCPTAQFRQFAVLAVPWALADFVAPVTTKLPGTPRAAFDAAHAELRQLICKGFEEGITRGGPVPKRVPKPAPNYAHVRACSPTCLSVESR
jgi:hypothetical protein